MSGVFRNIDPSPPGECVSPAFGAVGRTHSLGGDGVGDQYSSEDARHCSVLYLCKYFVERIYGYLPSVGE